jgi:hypothetical protein
VRGPGEDWIFRPVAGAPITKASNAQVGSAGTRRLEQLNQVDGLFWHGKLVAFRAGSTGEVVQTVDFGDQGWLRMLFFGMATAAAVLMYGEVALRKRKVSGGWWASGPKVFLWEIPRRQALRAAVLFVPACVGAILIYLSVPANVAGIVALIVAAAVVALVLWSRSKELPATPPVVG